VRYVFLVGGFAESKALQHRVKNELETDARRVIAPLRPGLAVVKGAVMLGLGAVLMQFLVQGAWGVVPAHLNELSPKDARGTFPGTVYQLGNLIASMNAVLQAGIAERTGGNYAIALAGVAITSALVIALCMMFGPEARDVKMT
jgi:SHS family lactate transporter-like MFS transporter